MEASLPACVWIVILPSEFSMRKVLPPPRVTLFRKSRLYSSRAYAVIAQAPISMRLIMLRIFQPFLQCFLLFPIQRCKLVLQIDVVTVALHVGFQIGDGGIEQHQFFPVRPCQRRLRLVE